MIGVIMGFIAPTVGKGHPRTTTATPTPIPANDTEALVSSVMGAGLYKTVVVVLALVGVGLFIWWAWSYMQG